jgi:hypothetical protein
VDPVAALHLTAGWMKCDATTLRPAYYYNTVCGVSQWEHPQLSFLTGCASRLLLSQK